MRKRTKSIVWGILLLAVAALLIASQVGFEFTLAGLSWFQIIVLACCAYGIISGVIELHLWEAAFGAGIGYYILSEPLGWPHISLWILLLSICVAGAGLQMIFRRKKSSIHWSDEHDGKFTVEYDSDGFEDGEDVVFAHSEEASFSGEDYLKGDLVFSSMAKYIESQDFRGGKTDVVFSHAKYYFDHAKLHEGKAVLNLDCVFSTVDIYVSREFNVVNNISRVFGGADYAEVFREGAPTLVIEGDCVFGSVRIHRV